MLCNSRHNGDVEKLFLYLFVGYVYFFPSPWTILCNAFEKTELKSKMETSNTEFCILVKLPAFQAYFLFCVPHFSILVIRDVFSDHTHFFFDNNN